MGGQSCRERFLSRLESGVFVSGGQVSGGEWKVGGSMTSKKIQIKKDKRSVDFKHTFYFLIIDIVYHSLHF